MTIAFNSEHLKQMAEAAETTYPNECCGLIAGHLSKDGSRHIVTRIAISPNVSDSNLRDSFEVDPKVRFDLMRTLEGTQDHMIGHYHSHPDHPAHPSETDLAMVYEPDLIWVIMSVKQSRVVDTRAYRVLPDATAFMPMEIVTTDTY